MATRSKPEQFQLRLPAGLRERIKAYAERHGRSMNAEIVRILEREFPAPWSLDDKIIDLVGLLTVVKKGATEVSIDRLSSELYQTLRGIASGRIEGLDSTTRDRVGAQLDHWDLQQHEDEYHRKTGDLDDEEADRLYRHGTTEKS